MTEAAGETVIVRDTGRGAFQTEATAGSATFLVDEPVEAGGLGTGPNPYDLLSTALGACTAMTIRLFARRKSWALDHVRVKVTHCRSGLDAQDHFQRDIELIGLLDGAQRFKLLDVAMHCPVHLTLERSSIVKTNLAPVPEELELAIRSVHARDATEACQKGAAR